MPDFRKATDFQVQKATPNARNEAIAEAIKNMEPEMRTQGRAIDWNKFRQCFDNGDFNPFLTGGDEEKKQKAIDAYVALVPDRRPEDADII